MQITITVSKMDDDRSELKRSNIFTVGLLTDFYTLYFFSENTPVRIKQARTIYRTKS